MAKENAIVTLTPARLRSACRWLAQRDSALREVLDVHGYPQLWNRLTEHWRPWRSVATRMLWLFYLNRR